MSIPKFRQVTGGSSRVVLYRETSPGVPDPTDPGIVLAMFEESITVSSNKAASAVITGKRGAGKPVAGLPDYSGGIALAAYSAQAGHLLRALCGAPVTTAEVAFAGVNGAAVNLGNGLVGLPCKGNPFVQDCAVTVVGSKNYDGTYRLKAGTNADQMVIPAVFVAETFSAVTVHRGKASYLEGEARDLGGGLVALPVGGAGSALSAGDVVTIAGTTGYDGTHTLEEGTNSNRIVFKDSYAAETLDGKATAMASFHRHEFALPKSQPTVTVVKELNFEEGAASDPYHVFNSCKVDGLSMSFGGESELRLDITLSVGAAENRPVGVNADLEPVDLPQAAWADKETAVWLDGDRLGDVSTGSVEQSFSIEAVAAMGDMGKRYRQTEGDPSVSIAFTAFLEEDRYQNMVDNANTVEMAVSMDNAVGDELWLRQPEGELDSSGPQINTKAGLTQEFTCMGFVDNGDTVARYTLINRVASYA